MTDSSWVGSRSARTALVALCAVLISFAAASAAHATDVVSATAPAPVTASTSGTTPLSGASVQDSTTPGQTLLVSVSTTLGSLSVTTTTGLTLSYGYSSFSGPTLSFTGTSAAANAALATLSLSGSTPGTATISVSATVNQAGVAYLPFDGHYFQFVSGSISWTAAQAAANALTVDGQEGYLAVIPDQATKNFVDAHLNGAENVWGGGMSTDYPTGAGPDSSHRAWAWFGQSNPSLANYGGPLAGTVFTECGNVSTSCTFMNTSAFFTGTWNTGEPNNTGYPSTGEHYLEINYAANPGTWNDIGNTDIVSGYVVEYGDELNGASNFTGQGAASSQSILAGPPGAPTGVTVVADPAGGLDVSWTAPVDNGGSPITGYAATATPAGGGQPSTCTTTGATSCTVTGLVAGVEYTVAVTAENFVGSSTGARFVSPVAPVATPTTTPTTTTTTTAPAPTGCPAASGVMTAGEVGPLRLGMTRAQVLSTFTERRVTHNGFDRFCLAGGAFRAGYPSAHLLAALPKARRSALAGRVVIALTANRHYVTHGVTSGTSVAKAKTRLGLQQGFRIGLNTWYATRRAGALWVLKTRGGRVQEVGVADSVFGRTPTLERRLLASFR
jgi:hypothetical protein